MLPNKLMTGAEFVCWCKEYVGDDLVSLDLIERYSKIITKPIMAYMIVPTDEDGNYLEKLHYDAIYTPKDGFEAMKVKTARRKMEKAKEKLWLKDFDVVRGTVIMGNRRTDKNFYDGFTYGYIYENRFCNMQEKTLEQLALVAVTKPIECTEYFWKKIVFDV